MPTRRGLLRKALTVAAGTAMAGVTTSCTTSSPTPEGSGDRAARREITGRWSFRRMPYIRPVGGVGQVVAKPRGSGLQAPFELRHDDSESYIFHLTGGPNMTGNAALIGLGIDSGARGLLANNKKTGVGISVVQNKTIETPSAYGFLGDQRSHIAALMRLTASVRNAATLLRISASVPLDPGTKTVEFGRSDDRVDGYVKGDDGRLVWTQPIEALGGLVLQSPGGKRFRLTVSDDGELSTTPDV